MHLRLDPEDINSPGSQIDYLERLGPVTVMHIFSHKDTPAE